MKNFFPNFAIAESHQMVSDSGGASQRVKEKLILPSHPFFSPSLLLSLPSSSKKMVGAQGGSIA
jgi:hypothetical protein